MYGFLLTFEGLWSHGIIYVILRLAVTETRESVKKRLQRFDVFYLIIFRFNFGNLGFWFPWSLVLLVVAAALFTYIALLLVCTMIDK